jgi:hypothetical protein
MAIQYLRRLAICILFMLGGVTWLKAQESVAFKRCGSMEVLEQQFTRNPALRTRFEKQKQQLRQAVLQRKATQNLRVQADTVYIPIVFHIVMQNPSVVTDAQIQAQLDTLNRDYAGKNGDSVKIPGYFKPLFGKSLIQFKIAARTPNNEPTTGITRTVTTAASYSMNDSRVKYTAQGGANIWDRDRYFNVWITNISGGILGYATFPQGSSPAEDGVVIHFSSLPGGSSPYDRGRTLTHETGHYFSLVHIWGDENQCSGSDDIDDTPNQSSATNNCPTGLKTDVCSPASPGVMYQNFMDYTHDACMVMFTKDQVTSMQEALDLYRSSYYTSNGADPVGLVNLDASVKSINSPLQRTCTPTFTPTITLHNRGLQTLTAVDIYASIDEGAVSLTHWTGSLNTLSETSVNLNSLTVTEGNHVLKVFVTAPNGGTDLNTANDTMTMVFQYRQPLGPPLTEGFESNTFPPAGWDIVNPDQAMTWQRVTGVAKTGQASVVMRNFNYQVNDQKDYLRLPLVNITNVDSAFLTFQVAAAVSSNPSSLLNPFDTLDVLVSTDCGISYTSLYKKWGSSLITRSGTTLQSFTPTAGEWRKDSVNLTPYINSGPLLLAFLNTANYENNIYLDDINLYSIAINPNLKKMGFLVTPNPTNFDGRIAVQFYPNPTNLRHIAIYSSTGQKVAERLINGAGNTLYNFDLNRFADGVYIVQVVFSDRTITQKFIKR